MVSNISIIHPSQAKQKPFDAHLECIPGSHLRNTTHLRKIHAESIHIHAIQEPSKALAEARQTLMHQLQLHEIALQIRHCVGQLSEVILKELKRRRRGRIGTADALYAVAKGGAGNGTEGCRWARARGL